MSQDKLADAARAAGFAMAADDELLTVRKPVLPQPPKAVIKAALTGQAQAGAQSLWQRAFHTSFLPNWTVKA